MDHSDGIEPSLTGSKPDVLPLDELWRIVEQ